MGRMGHPLCLEFMCYRLLLEVRKGTLTVSFLNVLTASGFFVTVFVVCLKARFGVISEAQYLGLAVLGTGEVDT